MAATAAGQLSPAGPDFQVNTWTTGLQFLPAVSAAPPGDFVVVWGTQFSPADSYWSIAARRFDPRGAPRDPQDFQVNSFTPDLQGNPDVAVASDGAFVVVWGSYGSVGPDVAGLSIQGQRFDAHGVPLGDQFQVNSATSSEERAPSVAIDPQGGFVVAWSSEDGYWLWSTQARRFDAAGLPRSPQFQVNLLPWNGYMFPKPAIGVAPSGRLLVVWESQASFGDDDDAYSVQARLFDEQDNPLFDDLQLNTVTVGYQLLPAVAVDAAGAFVVAWESGTSAGSDASAFSIQTRRVSADGIPIDATESQVNTHTTGSQSLSAVAIDLRGDYVFTWVSETSAGGDDSGLSIQARRFRADGTPLEDDFQVNSYTTGQQFFPGVAADALGDFVVTWHSAGSAGTDQSSTSIQARRFDGVLRDGFESGDVSRWSVAVPP